MSGFGNRNISGLRWSLGGFPFLAVTWEPEGIVLTPCTESAPYGYGFPKRDATTGELINPPFGTKISSAEDEALNQVLINQFANNKYLDRAEYVSGIPEINGKPVFELPETNPRLRATVDTEIPPRTHHTVIYWPLFFEPHHIDSEFWSLDENKVDWIDAPGINQWTAGYKFTPKKKPSEGEEILYRQFDSNRESLIYESETEDWFAHWPEELLYDNEAYEFIFKATNAERVAVGEEPIVREIRGFANVSRMVLTEMQRAKVQFHNNKELYRPGYGTALSRNLQGGTNLLSGGENLVSGIPSGLTIANAAIAMQGWIDSPGHYANMISSNWSSPKQATTLDIFGNVACTITESGPPDPEEFDPAISGRSYSQFFINRGRWLYAGTGGVNEFTFDNSTTPITHYLFGNMEYFFYKGRIIYFSPALLRKEQSDQISSIIGVTSYLDSNGNKNIRVLCTFVKDEYRAFACYTHPLVNPDPYGEESQWVLECEDINIYHEVNSILSIATFSLDGSIGIFSGQRKRKDVQASFYFPLNASDPIGYVFDQVVIRYENATFSIIESTFGPTITHTVETQTYGPEENPTQNTRISRYRQYGIGTLTYYPFYNPAGELVYLRQHIELEADQTYDGTNDTSYYKSIHSFEFPSGSVLESVHQVVENGNPIGPCYFLIFFYFDLLKEEAVYLRIDLTKVPPFAAHGNYTLCYWHNNIETVIKDYGTAVINSEKGFRDPQLRASWTTSSGPSTGQKALGVFDIFGARDRTNDGTAYPVITNSTDIDRWFCTSDLSIYYYPGSLLTGSFPMCMKRRIGNLTPCYSEKENGINYFAIGYSAGIPIVSPVDDGGLISFAHYKDKIVAQVFFTSIWKKTLSESERIQIWANFDLETLLGIANLKKIGPVGVIR